MKKLTELEVVQMNHKALIDALADYAYDMGISKVYLEAKNYEDDDEIVALIKAELERRLYERVYVGNNAHE